VSTDGNPSGFWTTLPGILTAVAGVITAVTGLLVVLLQTGGGDGEGTPDGPSPPIVASSSQSPSTGGATDLEGEGDALAGTWRGTAAQTDGSSPFSVRLEIAAPCRLREACGTISVSSTPCRGRATLWTVHARSYEFYVDKFTGDSSPDCSSGAGDFFRLLGDGTLRYTASYADVVGILHKAS